MLEQTEFDLVMTDYNMPEMKGDELAAIISSLKPNLPVVMITAYPELVPPLLSAW
jgi:CheY-like chemotaxis protein